MLRSLLTGNPGLRLVHRHLPLDKACNPMVNRPFHLHACLYAKLAVCAGEQGRFWHANDYLFAHGREPNPVTPEVMAEAVGLDGEKLSECLERRGSGMIRSDIEAGVRLGITGTPTFQVDGQLYVGQLPPQVLPKHVWPAGSGARVGYDASRD